VNPAVAAETSASHGVVELKIPAKAEWVAVARLAVAAVSSRLRFSVDEIEDIKLAIAEACTNCIAHAAENDRIEITSEILTDEVRVSVRDRSVGHKLGSVERAVGFAEGKRTEELGVFLIRALMDEVTYNVDPREGTELIMTKRVTE
jgi:serine/threonine-protein kinase RsbW